jgi:hypothetical protein
MRLIKDNVRLRRAAVRLFGQGPRKLAKGGAETLGAELLSTEEGREFYGPAVEKVQPELPECVKDWPVALRQEPPVQVWRMRNAGIYDENGVVYDRRSRQAVREMSAFWWTSAEQNPVFQMPRAKKVRHFPGRSVFLGGLGGQTFYHFLVEILPKLQPLGPWLPGAERLIVQRYIEPTKVTWLQHAGCDLPIEWLNSLSHFTFDELIFCMPIVTDCRPGPGALQVLRSVVGGDAWSGSPPRTRCIWASRLGVHAHRAEWEKRLIENLPSPWEVVDFAEISPQEAIDLGREVKAFAGLHGAAFSNLALWSPGVEVLEVYTGPNAPWYPCLSMTAKHNHRVVFAEGEASVPGIERRLAHLANAVGAE